MDFSFFHREIYEYYVNLTNRFKNNSSHKTATKNVTTTKEKLYGLGHGKFFKRLLPYGPYDRKITCEEFEEAMKELLIKKYAYRCLDPVPIYMVRQGRNCKKLSPEQVEEIRMKRYEEKKTIKELAKEYKVSESTIKKRLREYAGKDEVNGNEPK